jgi:galactokinase
MPADLPDRFDLAPELRLVSYAYREEFGRAPAGVWQAPGTVTLLADGELRLTVATQWGAIAAAGPRPDGIVEPVRMSWPGERVRLTVAQAAAGAGPAWASHGLRSARAGATLLVNTDLPEGSGVGAGAATQTVIGLALHDLACAEPARAQPARAGDGLVDGSGGPPGGAALLGERRLPFNLTAAGLRLLIIDTRVRGLPPEPAVERAPVLAAAAALEAGAIEALGPLLTAAHAALAVSDVQQLAVSAALGAGALGARMITDGPGRPVCVLLPAERLADVRSEVVRAFTEQRLRSPRFLTVLPAPGPRRAA